MKNTYSRVAVISAFFASKSLLDEFTIYLLYSQKRGGVSFETLSAALAAALGDKEGDKEKVAIVEMLKKAGAILPVR